MGRFSKLNKASIEGDQSKTVTVTLCSRIEYKKIFKKNHKNCSPNIVKQFVVYRAI